MEPEILSDKELEQITGYKARAWQRRWLADKGCGEVVEGVWLSNFGGAENTRVLKKIDSCGKELTNWSQKHFGSVRK